MKNIYLLVFCGYKGTGLDLLISKTFIEKNMAGRLAVRNTDNGSEFRIEVVHDDK
jgi:signal transduction histidine kinase